MNLPEELGNGQEFKYEILKPIFAIILIHIRWIILLGFIAYVIYDIRQYLSTGAGAYP